jgi:hypothetical protein
MRNEATILASLRGEEACQSEEESQDWYDQWEQWAREQVRDVNLAESSVLSKRMLNKNSTVGKVTKRSLQSSRRMAPPTGAKPAAGKDLQATAGVYTAATAGTAKI